ncbi:MAG TPA: glycosyltransferase family 1 protein, partial [Sphingomicrobium sp.]|nr:glycosyltransferase family 1 protein [Sphingomicrobium sp.]
MSLHDPALNPSAGKLFADVTQSWSAVGGGVRTYLNHKRRHILDKTSHRHLLIIPGSRDEVEVAEQGRAITITVGSPKVPGSPQYRLLLRNGAVREALARYGP